MVNIYMNGQKISREDAKNYEYIYKGERPLGLRKVGGEKENEAEKVSDYINHVVSV